MASCRSIYSHSLLATIRRASRTAVVRNKVGFFFHHYDISVHCMSQSEAKLHRATSVRLVLLGTLENSSRLDFRRRRKSYSVVRPLEHLLIIRPCVRFVLSSNTIQCTRTTFSLVMIFDDCDILALLQLACY